MATMNARGMLFSLEQLRRIEEPPIRQENEVARLRAEAERSAAEEVLWRARLVGERTARDDAERRADEARAETLRVAAVERARTEAEVIARLEVMRIVQEHERVLAALKEDKQKERLGRAVRFGAVGSVVVFVATAGLYLGKIKPEGEARFQAQQAEITKADEEATRLRQNLAERAERIRLAERALGILNGQTIAAPAPLPEPKPAPAPVK
jgi:colicin import membrane protein